MNGHKWALALAAAVILGGWGAMPRAREIESLQLVTTLAVDGGEEVTLTAVTGVRASEEEEPEVLTGRGDSLTAAWGELRGGSSRRAYLGQVEQLLVGEGQELPAVLELVKTHRELRLDTSLYIVKGQAGPALERSAQRVGVETGGRDGRSRTVGELLPRLAQGEYDLTPALAPDEEGQLAPCGWAVLGPEGIAGYLEGDAALGAELLLGKPLGQAVALETGGVELLSARVWAGPEGVRCTLKAQTVEGAPGEEELARWGRRVIRAALDAGWDCWGLDREIAALRPWDWEKWRGTDVRELPVTVTGRLVGEDGR